MNRNDPSECGEASAGGAARFLEESGPSKKVPCITPSMSNVPHLPYVTLTLTQSCAPPVTLAHVEVARDPSIPSPEPLDSSTFSYLWTGRHDGGALPPPSDTGHYAHALSALTETKAKAELEFQRLLAASTAAAAAATAAAAAPAAPHVAGVQEGGGEAAGTAVVEESAQKKPRVAGSEESGAGR